MAKIGKTTIAVRDVIQVKYIYRLLDSMTPHSIWPLHMDLSLHEGEI